MAAKERGIIRKLSHILFVCLFTAVALVMSLGTLVISSRAHPPQAAVLYVRVDGTDAGNGCTELMMPCATIQHAVDVAAAGAEIWVAEGVYNGVQARQAVTQHVYVSQSVTIRGGYGTTFASPPNPAANPTILDAAGLGRVMVVAEGINVTLVGLHLVNGDAGRLNGGGLVARQATVVIVNTSFLNNRAEFGGGLYGLQAQVTLQHSDFSGNQARLGGGAVRLYGGTAVLENSTFATNTAGLHGGGLYLSAGQATLTNNRVEANDVTDPAQGWGGGLHLSHENAALSGNTFSGNRASTGGGLRLFQSQAVLDANRIMANTATIGGGMSLEASSEATMLNTAFVDNTAALHVLNAAATLRHTTFTRNLEGVAVNDGQVALMNSIIASQTTGIVNVGGAVTLTVTLWDTVVQPAVGVVSETGALTGTAALAADGYHLTAVSAARDNGIDAGVTHDIDGLPRPVGSGFDLGAHEWRDLVVVKTVQPSLAAPGDLVTYTLVLSTPATPGSWVIMTDTLPTAVSFVGPLTYSAGSGGYSMGVLTWTGQIFTDTAVTLRWPAQLNSDLPPGTRVANTAVVQTASGTAPSTTAVVTIPAKQYLPFILRP